MGERETKRRGVAMEQLLREETESALDACAPRFDAFLKSVLTQLDDDSPAEPERVLRVDEASPQELADAGLIDDPGFNLVATELQAEWRAEEASVDWAAFAQGIDDGLDAEASADAVGALLRQDSAEAERGLDWAAFGQGIMDGIEAEEAAPALGAALRERVLEEVAAREGDWDKFSQGVMAQLPAQTVTVAELLSEATEAELTSRDGEWSAFRARIFEAVDAEARAAAGAPLEAQAVLQLKGEVAAEVEALSPGFGETFKKEVESEIFKSAQTPTPWWTSAWTRLRAWMFPEGGMSPGWAAAGMAAVLLVVVTGLPRSPDPKPGQIAPPVALGAVAIEQISFEGDVTVMPEEGITVVWLDAPT